MNRKLLRMLPKIDELLQDNVLLEAADSVSRPQLVDAVRSVVDGKRQQILTAVTPLEDDVVSAEQIRQEILKVLCASRVNSLRRVINGTGVVLHTNLGRAKLSRTAMEAVAEVACNYSTLEYDAQTGQRGSRHSHVESLIKRITGAEAAMVVNNNAAATMLCLAALGRGKEVVISRGELPEIGGSFRIPEIMEESGAKLVEVGTTNKTHLQDYECAVNEETGVLMKVHTSNYKVIGFTEDVPLEQLVALGREYGLPVVYDLGSGLMTDLSKYGVTEPTVHQGLAAGADVVLFSGDKLLGGPQGGIIAGKKEHIDKMKSHPLARAFRVDKMTLAAMEATFKAYYTEENVGEAIPVLSMLMKTRDEMENDAKWFAEALQRSCKGITAAIETENGVVGGGSAPGCLLENAVVALTHESLSCSELEEKLRKSELPIIVRVNHDRVIFDMRTLTKEELKIIAERLSEITRHVEEKAGE